MVKGHASTIAGRARLARRAFRALHVRRARQSTPQVLRSSRGFTLLEMLIVLFLLAGISVIVIPRIVIGEDLSSTGRKFIGVLRTLQGLAATSQKPVKLYLDLDQGIYWAMVVEGKEEKLPLDASWTTPRSLPESIRFSEVSTRQTKRLSGRVDFSFYPNGRIDPVTIHFTDGSNNLLALAVDSFTGAIRTSDERIEPPRYQTIPDRVKTLLQATVQGDAGSPLGLKF